MLKRLLTGALGFLPLAAAQAEPLRLVSPATEARYQQFWPNTDDALLRELRSSHVTWYDDESMPPAYQLHGGFHSPRYNISATKPAEPHGNANREFPWGATAGLENCAHASTIRFIRFPASGAPIRYTRQHLPHDKGQPTLVWSYPEGTVCGELLIMRNPEGYWETFEVRLREKYAGQWHPHVYRPYRSPTELAEQVRRLAPADSSAQRLAAYLEGPRTVQTALEQNRHPVRVFSRWTFADPLPPLDAGVVRKVLSLPFRSVAGRPWLESAEGTVCYAPTTDAPYHVVPQGYRAEALRVSTRACMDCHQTTLMDAFDLQPARDWYGKVRGSDGIFSFHIADPAVISDNGFQRPVRLRQELLRAGLLQAVR